MARRTPHRRAAPGLSRRGLLSSTFATLAGALAAGPAGATTGAPKAPKNLIWFFANGGWDVTFCMDPKLGNPTIEGPEVDEVAGNPNDRNVRSTFGDLEIVTNESRRPKVTRFFEDHGLDTLVINGIWTGSIVHEGCRMRILTGNSLANVPDLPTQIGSAFGAGLPLGSVDMSGLGYQGRFAASSGRVGARSQLKALLDPSSVFQPAPTAGYSLPLFTPSTGDREAIDTFLRARAAQLQSRVADGGVNDQRVADLLESIDRRRLLHAQGDLLVDRLQISTEPTLRTQALTAVDLITTQMCRSVMVSDIDSWDTHDINALQHDRYDNFFSVLGELVTNLKAAGVFDETVIVVASEMTRTPRRNWKSGKDHWAHTSMLLLGGGIQGNRKIGATDDALESMAVDMATGEPFAGGELLKYDNLAAGLLSFFDIDPAEIYPTITPLDALKA